MTKIEHLNRLLHCAKLDLPNIRRTVDPQGSNLKWLQKHLSARNSDHPNFDEINTLINTPIGVLVKQDV